MLSKPDISTEKLVPWDQYKDALPDAACASIYAQAELTSKKMCDWYWTSIQTKRRTSLGVRLLTFALVILGTALPIFAGLQAEVGDRLIFTQWGVAFLAIAGLLQLADKIFGWSSGWIRYIITVTTMENLTRAFQSQWGKFMLHKTTPLDKTDAEFLYGLASALEVELLRLQADETTKWAAEFTSGIALLESSTKAQRDETGGKLEAIRTGLVLQDIAANAGAKMKLHGALEANSRARRAIARPQSGLRRFSTRNKRGVPRGPELP
jgi:hypothetical protein